MAPKRKLHAGKRNAPGVVKNKPIALRLPPEELAQHEAYCKEHMLAKSNLAYEAYIAGLPIVAPGLHSADSSADPQGAASSPSGTSFSSASMSTV